MTHSSVNMERIKLKQIDMTYVVEQAKIKQLNLFNVVTG